MNARSAIDWKQLSIVLVITIATAATVAIAPFLADWLHADEFSILASVAGLFGMLTVASSVEERLRQRH